MGVWVDEPPVAAELRANYGRLVEQARLRAGAKKAYHQQPKRGLPEPTFDLVGGALSGEDMHQIDLLQLAALYQAGEQAWFSGQRREAQWIADRYRLRQAEMAAPLLAAIEPLRERWVKAEQRAAQPWASPEQQEGAYQAMRKIAASIAELHDSLDQFAPHLIPHPLFPTSGTVNQAEAAA